MLLRRASAVAQSFDSNPRAVVVPTGTAFLQLKLEKHHCKAYLCPNHLDSMPSHYTTAKRKGPDPKTWSFSVTPIPFTPAEADPVISQRRDIKRLPILKH